MIAIAWSTGPGSYAVTIRRHGRPLLVERPMLAVASGVVLGWIAISTIDALDSRRWTVQLLLLVAAGGAAWALSTVARREDSVDPIDAAEAVAVTSDDT